MASFSASRLFHLLEESSRRRSPYETQGTPARRSFAISGFCRTASSKVNLTISVTPARKSTCSRSLSACTVSCMLLRSVICGSTYFAVPSSSPTMIRPSAVRHKKSTLNCFPVRGSVKGTCNWGTENPFSIMTARAKDSPPFSLLASVYLSNLKMREQSRVVRAHSCKICSSSIPFEAASSKIGREWTKSIVRPQSSSVREGFVTAIPFAITAFSLGHGLYMILSFSCGRYDP